MNEFVDYYSKVKEDAHDMMNDMIDDFLDEVKEEGNYTYNTWERLNDSFLMEWNNHLELNLREAVEIIEQSKRPIDDKGLYMNAGDIKEQVKAMAYWTYQVDLRAEFKIALKAELRNILESFESKSTKYENEINELSELIEEKEKEIDSLEEQMDTDNEEINKTEIENKIQEITVEVEKYQEQMEKIQEELEPITNGVYNLEQSIEEL